MSELSLMMNISSNIKNQVFGAIPYLSYESKDIIQKALQRLKDDEVFADKRYKEFHSPNTKMTQIEELLKTLGKKFKTKLKIGSCKAYFS
jgi:hypothetical protein